MASKIFIVMAFAAFLSTVTSRTSPMEKIVDVEKTFFYHHFPRYGKPGFGGFGGGVWPGFGGKDAGFGGWPGSDESSSEVGRAAGGGTGTGAIENGGERSDRNRENGDGHVSRSRENGGGHGGRSRENGGGRGGRSHHVGAGQPLFSSP